MLDVYAAREEPVGPLAGERPPGRPGDGRPRRAAGRCSGSRDRETAARELPSRLREGDLLVTIGAGDITKLAEELVE